MERRSNNQPARVAKRADGSQVITGYAAVFYRADDPGTEYQMWSDLVERIAPGAFDVTQDVRGLFNHDPSMVLGRSSANTMRLSVDQTGLRYEIDMADTTIAKDVAESIHRGDVTGSSFGFLPTKIEWEHDEKRRVDIRTIRAVDLYDVGPVTFPAYESTTAGVRSDDDRRELIESRNRWRMQQEEVRVRLKLLTLDD